MISQKAKYALRALVALVKAPPESSLMIAEISKAQAIPKKFLEQILLELKRHGIVASRRGRLGGYVLLKPADKITFGEVLRLIDGPIAPLPCLSKIAYRRCADCQDEASCEIRHVFAHVVKAQRDVLDHTTFADAVANNRLPEAAL
ncbi:MAG: Rrf2 family transcriptional regulator [Hyphomicrobiales bacterium]|nr:MAG: Rrf2 family transcriptional regulator [Hyphomicrobiales bacterium]